jgi:hypothetical protein
VAYWLDVLLADEPLRAHEERLMYALLLVMHSTLRWLVVLAAIVAVARALSARNRWTPGDDAAGLALLIGIDLQVLLGLILYVFLSPITTLAVHQLHLAMTARVARFWTIEHPLVMIIALALVHVGRVRIRRAGDPQSKRRAALLFYGLALLAILGGVPWPVLPYGRPLLPVH